MADVKAHKEGEPIPIKEEVKIDIKKDKDELSVSIEDNEENEDKTVKDIDIELNITTGSEASYVTKKINGELLAVVISTNKKVKIVIGFEEVSAIELYKNIEFEGARYMPLKVASINHKADRFSFAPDLWQLNNKLRISIEGQSGTLVGITLRYR